MVTPVVPYTRLDGPIDVDAPSTDVRWQELIASKGLYLNQMLLRWARYFVTPGIRPPVGRLRMHVPNSFGVIEHHTAEYIVYPRKALHAETSEPTFVDAGDRLVRFFQQNWHLNSPDVVISVVGSAHGLKALSPQLRRVLDSGLVSLCERTQVWLITGALDSGVMRQIAKPLQAYKFRGSATPVIGIAVKRTVAGLENLDAPLKPPGSEDPDGAPIAHPSPPCPTLTPLHPIPIHHIPGALRYNPSRPSADGRDASLNQHHSHFVLVDTHKGEWGSELKLRSQLEASIARTTCPVVTLCLQGEPLTLLTVQQSLKAGKPVIVAPETGGAAAVLGFHLGLPGLKEPLEYYEWIVQDKVLVHDRSVVGLKTVADDIREMNEASGRSLVHMFGASSGRPFDQVVLEVLVARNLRASRAADAARLAISWDLPKGLSDILAAVDTPESLGTDRQRGLLLTQALRSGSESMTRSLIAFGCEARNVDLSLLYAEEKQWD